MDLSTGGDLDACREAIIQNSTVPIGTVPIYSMIIGRTIEDLTYDMILKELENQAKQGVDYFTIHAGVLREHLPFVRKRLIGIVSPRRIAAGQVDDPPQQAEPDVRDLRRHLRHHARVRRHASRSATACAPAAWPTPPTRRSSRELATLGELTERAWAQGRAGHGRGPGPRAVRPDRIQHEAPAQALPRRAVLRARAAGDRHLPRLRPHHQLHRRDRRRLPRRGDALLRHAQGAPGPAEEGRREAGLRRLQDRRPRGRRGAGHPRHARPRRRADQGPRRPQLAEALRSVASTPTSPAPTTTRTWRSTPTSAPCAATTGARVRISKEITEFYSGKDEAAQPAKKAAWHPPASPTPAPKSSSSAASSRQEEIHKLAHKGKKADCHSDNVARRRARRSSCRSTRSRPRGGGERERACEGILCCMVARNGNYFGRADGSASDMARMMEGTGAGAVYTVNGRQSRLSPLESFPRRPPSSCSRESRHTKTVLTCGPRTRHDCEGLGHEHQSSIRLERPATQINDARRHVRSQKARWSVPRPIARTRLSSSCVARG